MPGHECPGGVSATDHACPGSKCAQEAMPGGVCARVVHAQGGHACPGVSMPRGACVVRTPPHEQND